MVQKHYYSFVILFLWLGDYEILVNFLDSKDRSKSLFTKLGLKVV